MVFCLFLGKSFGGIFFRDFWEFEMPLVDRGSSDEEAGSESFKATCKITVSA